MWIIKLGGSLLGTPELVQWLEMFVRHGNGKVVIVPGGSIFADTVRDAQKRSDCSDEVAHQLAVMAMDQYGVLMAGLNPKLVTAQSELEIAERGWQHRAIVWLPSAMIRADDAVPANWQVTSDSLAAWLATKLNAEHLILIKSRCPQARQMPVQALVEDGLVDAHFGKSIVDQNFNTWILNKRDHGAFTDEISQEALQLHGMAVHASINRGQIS